MRTWCSDLVLLGSFEGICAASGAAGSWAARRWVTWGSFFFCGEDAEFQHCLLSFQGLLFDFGLGGWG